ncbi:MAG: helix-turn-helix domain-containing protein [Deltaproteobacteria bacterium]|nr:helix-turn-helix domain-containing protein [Deltaproteobacteria bacterium]
MTSRQVAERLGLARVTVEMWRVRGKGPRYFKLGRSVRYARADVEAWVASCAIGGAA